MEKLVLPLQFFVRAGMIPLYVKNYGGKAVMRIFDTHAHYDSGAFNSDRYELLADLPNQDVELILNPGCDLKIGRAHV